MIDTNTIPPLSALREEMAACIKCAACMPVCPTYQEERRESRGPRGRLALAVGLLEGRLRGDEGAVAPISSCIDCRACVPACPRHIPLAEVFYAAKGELSRQGSAGWPVRLLAATTRHILLKRWMAALLPLGRMALSFYHGIADGSPVARFFPFFRNGKKRNLPDIVQQPMTGAWPEVVTPAGEVKGRVAFFPGCVINFTGTDIGHATVRALSKLGVEVVIPRDAPCCGIPLLSLGDRAAAREVARDVINRYSGLEVDWVITACASCGTTLRDTYPTLVPGEESRDFAAKVLDVAEFITRHTDYRERAGHLDVNVTYHDPCHLVRGMGVTEEPREILRRVAGGGFKEMAEADTCCGFGGLFSALHYDLSLKVGANKAGNVADSGASLVATGCPGCQMQMHDTLSRAGVNARVVHTVELLDRALEGENVSPNVSRLVSLTEHFM